MKSSVTAVIVVAVFVAGFAIGRMSAPSPATASDTTQAAATPSMPPAAAAPMMANNQALPPSAGTGVTGTVQEVIQVPSYTYLRIATSAGDAWAAITSTPDVKEGQTVSITGSEMHSFASKTLNRTFDSIWFGQLAEPGAAAPMQAAQGGGELPPGHPAIGGSTGGPDSLAAEAAAALKGADNTSSEMKVAKVYEDRLSLKGRRVRVRGMVKDVKKVAGNTFLHLSDGSGSSDLPVVTKTALGQDEVVTLEGLVAVDTDPGTGTAEKVVMQDAQVLAR